MRRMSFYYFVLLFLLMFFLSGCTSDQQKYSEEFEGYAEYFQSINDMVLNAIENDQEYVKSLNEYGEQIYIVERDDREITGLYKFPQKLSKEEIFMLSLINEFMNDDFESIVCFDSRISYQGDGGQMIVYSPDEKPDFFFYPGDGLHFHAYKLQENWYLLIHPIR